MIIVKVMAGLGNQMFQYALFRSLLKQGRDAKLDISYYKKFLAHNGYELPRIFNITEYYATKQESSNLGDIRLDIISRIIRKFIYTKKTHIIQNIGEGFGFDPTVLELDNLYLQGYWQSEKYFLFAEDELRRDFTFKKPLDPKNQSIEHLINQSNSISLHVRRGDYVKAPNLGEVCTIEYYRNAINYIKSSLENPAFFVFSDDICWCKQHLQINNAVYVEGNYGLDSYKDMQLMSSCKHNIISNSSFSWWGAWLNSNKKKIVIAPDKWFKDRKINVKDIIPDTWLKIKTE